MGALQGLYFVSLSSRGCYPISIFKTVVDTLLCPQACESPLLVAVAAGSLALPTLLKLATLMAGQNQDFLTCNQLPVVSALQHPAVLPPRPAVS